MQATGWEFGAGEFGAGEFGAGEFGAGEFGAGEFGGALPPQDRATVYERVAAEPEFTQLRRRLRGWVFPMTAAFLLWYLAYVLLASYARDVMAKPVSGGITVGLLVGLAQFVSTFALTAAYVRFARRRIDPLAAQIRADLPAGGVR